MPQPAKAQRARAPAQLMGRARTQCERGAAVCTDQAPFGVCAAELNYELCMRVEATDPHDMCGYGEGAHLLLWLRCFLQPDGVFTWLQRWITTGASRDWRPCPYSCAAEVPPSCYTRAGENGKSPNSGAAAAPAAWQPSANACDVPRDRGAHPGGPCVFTSGRMIPPSYSRLGRRKTTTCDVT